jgi:hypothetical protein
MDLDESGAFSVLQSHVRAKILSNEGRDLGNVEIPLRDEGSKLVKWWGRTIHPDGTVDELPMDKLQEQTISQRGRHSRKVLKGLLPAIEPGCVIDYGYRRSDRSWSPVVRVRIEDRWPVRQIIHRWTPISGLTPAATLRKEANLDAVLTREGNSYVLKARNVPAGIDEPLMPPEYETRSAATFYYIYFNTKGSTDFWNAIAEWIEQQVHAFGSFNVPVFRAIDKMAIPADADLDRKLRTAYDWLAKNTKAAERQSIEEMELGTKKSVEKFRTAGAVLSAGTGTAFQLDLLYISLARALGAEAEMVLASDRTSHDWHRNLLTLDQFDESLVAVRPRGAPPEQAVVLDAGSGLPYGEFPWWVAGGKAMVVAANGARDIQLKPTAADRNVSETTGTLNGTDLEEGRVAMEWTRTGTGQSGYQERLDLRSLAPGERASRLAGFCGEGSDTEISRAEAPDLDDLNKPLRLHCAGEITGAMTARGSDEMVVKVAGPWFQSIPEVPASPRHLPVDLSYARVERATMEVSPPSGFAASPPPAPIEIDSPFGGYRLRIDVNGTGYRVDREFRLSLDRIQPGAAHGFVRFLAQVRSADRPTLTFRRSEGAGSSP